MDSKNSRNKIVKNTPKLRRRSKTIRSIHDRQKHNLTANESVNSDVVTVNNSERCESPYLPCNQYEFMFNSANTSTCSVIPRSPDLFENSINDNWESFSESTNLNQNCSQGIINKELEGLIEEIFVSKLNKSISIDSNQMCKKQAEHCLQNQDTFNIKPKTKLQNEILLEDNLAAINSSARYLYDRNLSNHGNDNKSEKTYEDIVDDSFKLINQSICNYDVNNSKIYLQSEAKGSVVIQNKNNMQNELFSNENQSITYNTADPYRVCDILKQTIDSSNVKGNSKLYEQSCANRFYGLPIAAKDLFKTFRKIEKFYDWQEECLNLDAVENRRNLVYALPTSGGKTLVAEVLMLREVLNRKKNALFVLPYVAIVQEKIWALSPFAVQLDFLLEEYAGGKGSLPPKKRRKKNSIYVATIEKGLALVRSLIELKRLDELGLIVVDELHLIGEKGRGGTLETLLTTVIFTNRNIQIVGMSATIGNLHEVATFLRADVFERQFRPVELTEYVKLGSKLYRIVWNSTGMEIVPDRDLAYNYTKLAASMDPDLLGGLVSEVVPEGSCLVFCPTKRNCENVVALLCKLQRKDMVNHRKEERESLERALRTEGSNNELSQAVRFGIAYHHAGLASDERVLLENAFRSGVISVLCCTSTLAAGVNLPARRVVVRAPLVATRFLTLAAYRQMVGRAGRAGVCHTGESIIICGNHEWMRLQAVLSGGVEPATSSLQGGAALVLGAVAYGLANTRADIKRLLSCSFLAVAGQHDGPIDIDKVCGETINSLIKSGGLEVDGSKEPDKPDSSITFVSDNSLLKISKFAKAAIKGCMELSSAKQLIEDLEVASKSLVMMGSLHLLYLVTPHDAAGVKPDYSHYYSLYCNLDEEGLQTAKVLGVNEMNAVRMIAGKELTGVSEIVLRRFYVALMLHDLWKQMSLSDVARKYLLSRGVVQSVMQASSSLASCAQRVCEELQHMWGFAALFSELAPRLRHCTALELHHLLELPSVKKARALQLVRAGYKRIEDIAKAKPEDLVSFIAHLSITTARQLISAARLMLIEKVENLRAEAEDVIEELKL